MELPELTKRLYRAAGKLNFYVSTYDNRKLELDINKLSDLIYANKSLISRTEVSIQEKTEG